ncbi:MAG: hypothetical protein KF819_40640 [Labilithrix sp.]|nr:hypothetical protein [Labilithrix sp.]
MSQPYGQQPYGMMGPQAPFASPMIPAQKKRNVALIVVGIVLAVIALGAGVVFVINLHQYLTIEDRWANDPLLSPAARRFGVALVQGAAKKRMTIFGPISGLFGLVGLVLFGLGLRKK